MWTSKGVSGPGAERVSEQRAVGRNQVDHRQRGVKWSVSCCGGGEAVVVVVVVAVIPFRGATRGEKGEGKGKRDGNF